VRLWDIINPAQLKSLSTAQQHLMAMVYLIGETAPTVVVRHQYCKRLQMWNASTVPTECKVIVSRFFIRKKRGLAWRWRAARWNVTCCEANKYSRRTSTSKVTE